MKSNEIDEVDYSKQILCQKRTIVEVTFGGRIGEEHTTDLLRNFFLYETLIYVLNFSVLSIKKNYKYVIVINFM